MEANTSTTDTVVSVIGAIFGTAHFVFQSAADITAHGESKLVAKVTKGKISYEDRMSYRRVTTFNKQQDCLDQVERLKDKLRNKRESNSLHFPTIVT